MDFKLPRGSVDVIADDLKSAQDSIIRAHEIIGKVQTTRRRGIQLELENANRQITELRNLLTEYRRADDKGERWPPR